MIDRMDRIKPNHHKFIVALALLAWLVNLCYFVDAIGSYQHQDYYQSTSRSSTSRQLLQTGPPSPPPEQFDVCGRAAGFHVESWPLQRTHDACPTLEDDAPLLLLAGRANWGHTENQPWSLLYAL